MPAFWVYKCNSRNREYQRAWGDWAEVFETTEAQWWGTTKVVPELAQAKVGDTIVAYQTDRNELVGIARVLAWKPQGKHKRLVLKPLQTLGVRVRPLKKADAKVARIPALQPGQIRTLYPISRSDARILLKAAGVYLGESANEPEDNVERSVQGAGFGSPEQNRRVEKAAVRHVTTYFRDRDWSVGGRVLKQLRL